MYAAAAGYTGMMVAWGCTVWGSGWYYPPYIGYGGYYPYYYPHFPTYGYSAWYNPWTGAYGRSAGVYGPYGGAGVGARYNPRTGTYARGAAAYGPYGARGVAQAYNPRTGTYAATRQGSNVYGSWGSTAVQRGDDWAKTNRYTNSRTGTTTRTIRTDEGSAVTRRGAGGGRVAVGDGGNVYAGKDGNAYRRAGRHVAEVRQWRLVEHRPAAERRKATADRSVEHHRTPDHDQPPEHDGSQHHGSAQSRCRRAPRGHTANHGLWELPERRQQHPQHRQLPRRRGWCAGGRRQKALVSFDLLPPRVPLNRHEWVIVGSSGAARFYRVGLEIAADGHTQGGEKGLLRPGSQRLPARLIAAPLGERVAADVMPSGGQTIARICARSSLRTRDAKLCHACFKGRRRQPEPCGSAIGAADAPSAAFDDVEDVLLLDVRQLVAPLRRG